MRSPRMLEEWEKMGPRMRRSRGGKPARWIMEALSSSRISEDPHRSSRIHRRAPAFFFPTFPDPAAAAAAPPPPPPPPEAAARRAGGGVVFCAAEGGEVG